MPFKVQYWQLQEQREQRVGSMERMIFLLYVGWEKRPSIAGRPRERVCE